MAFGDKIKKALKENSNDKPGKAIVKDLVTGRSGKAAGKFYHKVGKDLDKPLKDESPKSPGTRASTPTNMSGKTAKDWVRKNRDRNGGKGYK